MKLQPRQEGLLGDAAIPVLLGRLARRQAGVSLRARPFCLGGLA